MNAAASLSADRLRLATLPTPLEPLPALSRHLGGPQIWVKRDDCTGLAGGGNKARKLDYLMQEALRQGADTVITAGGLQSNHARQTAAAAARLGLACILALSDSVPGRSAAYHHSANLLLDRLFGAEIRLVDASRDPLEAMGEIAAACTAAGRRPYVIPVGGSNAVGALGYVAAVDELLDQAEAAGVAFDHIVVTTGSGGTHAGIVAGLALRGLAVPVTGISVSRARADAAARVQGILEAVLAARGGARAVPAVEVDDRFIGAGYGQPTAAMAEAVRAAATTEGLLLDPVYTGKAMAGLMALVREGRLRREHKVLFWHTGGSIALFAYDDVFAGA